MSIGSRMKERRKALGLTQNEVGDMLGCSGSAIGNYENEYSTPQADIMYKIFDVLKTDANFIYQDYLHNEDRSNLERQLLMLFNEVNDEGQEKIIDYADDLVRSGKYEKKSGKHGVGKEA